MTIGGRTLKRWQQVLAIVLTALGIAGVLIGAMGAKFETREHSAQTFVTKEQYERDLSRNDQDHAEIKSITRETQHDIKTLLSKAK